MFTTWKMWDMSSQSTIWTSGYLGSPAPLTNCPDPAWPRKLLRSSLLPGARSWSGQGSRRYQRRGQISFIIFTIRKYRIGDYRIYPGHVFKSLETILMILVIRKSLLQGLFRKYYGVECKHPSVYSKDIVEIVWQTETDRLIQGYLRCLLCVCDTGWHGNMITLCTDQGWGHHKRFGSFLDLFWWILSFFIIHLLSTADKIAATNYLL